MAGIQVEGMRGEGTAFSLEFKGAVDVSFGRYDKTVYSANILDLWHAGGLQKGKMFQVRL